MGLKIKWSEKAENEFDKILDYWNRTTGSKRYSIKLIKAANDTLEKLSRFPESGKKTNKELVRYKIFKNYFLYYTFDANSLNVVDICDMRRDPEFIRSLFL